MGIQGQLRKVNVTPFANIGMVSLSVVICGLYCVGKKVWQHYHGFILVMHAFAFFNHKRPLCAFE